MVRKVTWEIGKRFAQAGTIEEPFDVYFLMPEEVEHCVLPRHIVSLRRQVARMEPFIVVGGTLQKKDGILNIVAENLSPLREETDRQHTMYPAPAAKARNFA